MTPRQARIYAIKHDGKVIYVGNTMTSVEERFRDHFSRTRTAGQSRRGRFHCPKLHTHMQENNFTGYTLEILEFTSEELRYKREKHWIKKFDTRNNGCNGTIGGMVASGKDHYMWGKKAHPKALEESLKAHKGKPLSAEWREAISRGNKGKSRETVSHKVRCVTTGEEFKSIVECAKHFKVTMFTIQMILKGKSDPDRRVKLKGLEFVRV